MITVKQYADERGITIQAVHQSMQGKRKKERLQGHVQVIDGIKWLDEEAVLILDESRQKSPIVIEKADNSELIEQLEREVKQLLVKTAAQADEISELAKWKADHAVAIAESNQKQLLLEEKLKEISILEGFLRDANNNIKYLQEEKMAEVKAAEDKVKLEMEQANSDERRKLKEHYGAEIKRLEEIIQNERNRKLTLYERLTGKKK